MVHERHLLKTSSSRQEQGSEVSVFVKDCRKECLTMSSTWRNQWVFQIKYGGQTSIHLVKRQRLGGWMGRAKESGDKNILITQSQAVLSSIGYQMGPFFYEVQNGPALSLEDSTGAQALALQTVYLD